MSLVWQKLAPHLPYVRRYARALTGDQATGDNYVRVALEAWLPRERQLRPNMTPRVALYQVFHAIWSSTGRPAGRARAAWKLDDDAIRAV